MSHHPGSGSFHIQEMISQLSPSTSQQRIFHHYHPAAASPQGSSASPSSSFLNEQMFLSAAAQAASHSYPPPSSFLSTLAASNMLSSINAHMHSIEPEQQVTSAAAPSEYFFEPYQNKKNSSEALSSPLDVKNLIGSSLTALGLDQVNEDEFDKAASNEATSEFLLIDNDAESFERSTTPATNNTSPTHATTISSASSVNPMTRPVNIPHSFTHEHFSQSSSAKSPFDAPNQLFDGTLGSVGSTQPQESNSELFCWWHLVFSGSSPSIHLSLNLRRRVVVVADQVNCTKCLVSAKICRHLLISYHRHRLNQSCIVWVSLVTIHYLLRHRPQKWTWCGIASYRCKH